MAKRLTPEERERLREIRDELRAVRESLQAILDRLDRRASQG
ncbi:MAG TPA: hypothetical protein VFJ77_02940 [Gaiellaceae bacterium]|nr:hypothetical protein [Gaiellaceae bacterium]